MDGRVRLSASLVLVCPATLQILFVRRSPQARFMPNMCVFPGGAVDSTDDDGRSDLACRIAALRETFEETGLLYRPTRVDHFPVDSRLYFRDHMQPSELASIAASLHPLCEWQTPRDEVLRLGPKGGFRTKFYCAVAPSACVGSCDLKETTDIFWLDPKKPQTNLPIPQQYIMNEFAKFSGPSILLFVGSLRRGIFKYLYHPVKVESEGKIFYVFPGDFQHDVFPCPVDKRWLHRAYMESGRIVFLRSDEWVESERSQICKL